MTSNSQIDKLGNQLRDSVESGSPLDVKPLDDYRRTFTEAADELKNLLNGADLHDFTERNKSTPSIVAKLSRKNTMRLSQMQDIVGLRFVVDDLVQQDALVGKLLMLLGDRALDDKRLKPDFGYRAVHVIARSKNKLIEIQIRTYFQHLWAQFSEMLSDREGHGLKYGAGDSRVADFMSDLSVRLSEREIQLHQTGAVLSRDNMQEEFEAELPRYQAQY
jgi:putative GTP pyrophosphokinase